MLRFSHPDWVAMQSRQAGLEGTGEIRLRELVKQALRMRPSRLVIGEVRAEECLDLLLALNAGLPGMATLHANSAREALVKMCTLPLLAGENVGSLTCRRSHLANRTLRHAGRVANRGAKPSANYRHRATAGDDSTPITASADSHRRTQTARSHLLTRGLWVRLPRGPPSLTSDDACSLHGGCAPICLSCSPTANLGSPAATSAAIRAAAS